LASRIAGMTGANHHAQLIFLFFKHRQVDFLQMKLHGEAEYIKQINAKLFRFKQG
jgi:hypothetical protein